MKHIAFILSFLFVAGCGEYDVLNPVPQDELQQEDEVVVVLPDGEVIVAEVEVEIVEPATDDPNIQCTDAEYIAADFVVVDCKEEIGLVAEGVGCPKSIRLMTDEEHEEWCGGV